ncbi:MAG: D-aminoacylase [Clostridia bacterium]|nr:D-aminoacylase [Clostridia bacterium]
MLDLLIQNARIVDGTGMPAYYSHVGIREGKIAVIAPVIKEEVKAVIDAKGLTLTPGFVDSHSHDDMIMETVPACAHKLEQGVTTQIVGMCGHSAAPLSEQYYDEGLRICMALCANGVNTDLPSRTDFKTYLNNLREDFGTSMGFHIGHGTVRTAVMGFERRKPTAQELERMKDHVRDAMEAGALGISFGMIYTPGTFADTEEMIELCKVVVEYGGDMTIHMRNEGARLVEAVEETLRIVRETGIRCIISHHKASGGPNNWGKVRQTIPMIEQINREGYTVFLDQYPFIASSTGLMSEIPSAFLSLPRQELLDKLADPEGRKPIAEAMLGGRDPEAAYERLMIGASKAYPQYSGMMVPEAAKLHGKSRVDTILDVLMADNFASTEISFGMCEEDVEYVMAYPRTMIGTDGLWYPDTFGAHPRAFASFPRVLGHYVRERGVVSFEEAIRKMTSMPAALYGLKGKGMIREGYNADLCLLDPDTIIDAANYKDWNARCPGLKHVFVAGEAVVTDSVHDGRLLGKKLLRSW